MHWILAGFSAISVSLWLSHGVACSWSVLVNVQPEGEARLLSVAAIVPDPCVPINNAAAGVGATSGAGSAGSDQTMENALAEGLRCVVSVRPTVFLLVLVCLNKGIVYENRWWYGEEREMWKEGGRINPWVHHMTEKGRVDGVPRDVQAFIFLQWRGLWGSFLTLSTQNNKTRQNSIGLVFKKIPIYGKITLGSLQSVPPIIL